MTPLSHKVFERARCPREPRQPLAQAADHARRVQAAIDTLTQPCPTAVRSERVSAGWAEWRRQYAHLTGGAR